MTSSTTSPIRSSAAIYYHPDGYITTRGKLMGRHAAGEGFLRGFARYSGAETLYAFAESKQHFQQFSEQVKPFANGKATAWVPKAEPERLAEAGSLYIPGPDLSEFSWQRRFHDAAAYSITGVTHTICSDRVMDSLGSLLIAPVEEWDAIIFTSKEVKAAAQNIMNSYGEYLGERFACKPVLPRLQMPVIPLGVDCAHLAGKGDNEAVRNKLREQYQIGAEDIVVLFFGRLSYHAKAHPLPMYLALEAASKKTTGKIHLIQAGWFANDSIKNAFVDAARRVCPSINCLFVDGRSQNIRDHIWRAADIFCSLSDNIQETFGLTPIEAMAAGLPVVVSDWDGYRDTMEPGATGFTVPTTIPAAGCGKDLMYRYYTGTDTYDQYIGNVSQTISVDVEATTRAFIELIENPDLRRRMGEKGQQRAREKFDWQVVIGQYEALWQELGERRAASGQSNKQVTGNNVPLRADPFATYPHYATQVLGMDSRIQVTVDNPFKVLPQLASLSMNNFSRATLAPEGEIKDLLRKIRKSDNVRLGDLLADTAPEKHLLVQRSIGWLAKLGIVRCNS